MNTWKKINCFRDDNLVLEIGVPPSMLLPLITVICLTESSLFLHDGHSKMRPISCGIPQGSILVPLMLILLMNEIGTNLK